MKAKHHGARGGPQSLRAGLMGYPCQVAQRSYSSLASLPGREKWMAWRLPLEAVPADSVFWRSKPESFREASIMERGSAFLSLLPPKRMTRRVPGALILPTFRHTCLRSAAKAYGLEWSIWPFVD